MNKNCNDGFWKWLLQYTWDNLVYIKNGLKEIPKIMVNYIKYLKEECQWKIPFKFWELKQSIISTWEFITDPILELFLSAMGLYMTGIMIIMPSYSPDPLLSKIQWLGLFGLFYLMFAHGQFRRTCPT